MLPPQSAQVPRWPCDWIFESKRSKNLHRDYALLTDKLLGQGSYGKVFMAQRRRDAELCACKVGASAAPPRLCTLLHSLPRMLLRPLLLLPAQAMGAAGDEGNGYAMLPAAAMTASCLSSRFRRCPAPHALTTSACLVSCRTAAPATKPLEPRRQPLSLALPSTP